MPNEEWKRLQEALRQAPTPEARRAAAEAMRRYLAAKGKGSKPTLVSLGYRKSYPHAIPLENLADELERNPEFFELFGRIAK